MAMFNSYVSLQEGTPTNTTWFQFQETIQAALSLKALFDPPLRNGP